MDNTKIINNDDINKNVISRFSFILLIISIIGCILAIADYHLDLRTTWSNGKLWNDFLYIFNIGVIIGNMLYFILSVQRSNKYSPKLGFIIKSE